MGRYTPNADKRKASLSRVIRCLLLQSDRRRQLAHGQGPQRTRIKAVLFYQNPRGQRFGGVVRQNRNAGLFHNRAAIQLGGDQMHAAASLGIARIQRALMGV
jgi:hypothetical protein